MLVIDRKLLGPDGMPGPELLGTLLRRHAQERVRLDEIGEIYARRHRITSRRRLAGLPNNRLAHDLPGYIATMAAGYLVGSPVRYAPPDGQEDAFEAVRRAYGEASVESVDAELAMDAAVYGKAVELCYADALARPRVAQMDPRSSFVVYDDTVEHRPLLGLMLREMLDENLDRAGEHVTVYTAQKIFYYQRKSTETPHLVAEERHFFGQLPLTEYWNNSREMGDFEPVTSLIDAYDLLQSDRLNDKQQFTDAIMILKGVGGLSPDDTAEEVQTEDGIEEATTEEKEQTLPSERLRRTRMLFLPEDASAEYITKPDSESGNEVLRNGLKEDIHKFSFVPDLSDKNFAGTASGVSMRYKLFGLEQLVGQKEQWFREGLRQRLSCLNHFLKLKGAPDCDTGAVQIAFTRSLPVNDLEVSQTLMNYSDMVPRKLLLSQVPFVEDPDKALQMLDAEEEERRRQQQELFTPGAFREDGTQAAEDKPPKAE